MCGIIGINSEKSVINNIISSLKKLEYRGYDSAGIALFSNNFIDEVKCEGRVAKLEKICSKKSLKGTVGIGHVRWATHGAPNEINSHPHSSEKVSVVHNGIIENSTILKKILEKKGYKFKSETDTEVITFLLTENLKKNNLITAIQKTLEKLHGSYALAILFKDNPDLVVGARRGSPLAVGYGDNENYLGSDSYALKSMTNKISFLDDGDICLVKKDHVEFYNSDGKKVNKKIFSLSKNVDDYDKGDFQTFMQKEIFEQPQTAKSCINEYIDDLRDEINIYNFPWDLKSIKSIILIGCGTAFHACMMAKYWLEELTNIDVSIDIASEFRYRKNKFKKDSLYIFVSQSGETADTLAALELCKNNKMKTLSIVNVVESSIARSSDFVLPIHCGPEIGVASTKAFIGQLLTMYILALKVSHDQMYISKKDYQLKIKSLKKIPNLLKKTLSINSEIEDISKIFSVAKGCMFLGRGSSYPIAMEGALKLKELCYVHAEGYPAGEMKHGPLALIEEGIPVVIIAPRDKHYEKTLSNMQEVIARGAKVLLISNKSKDEISSVNVWKKINVEQTIDELLPLLLTLPLQLLALYAANEKGCDIDKPRNLAKSVTVE